MRIVRFILVMLLFIAGLWAFPADLFAACSAAPTASTSDAMIRFKNPSAYAQVIGIASPGQGDLVYDTTNSALKLCDGTNWNTIGGTVSGSSGYVQFNSSGSFGSDSNLYWDNTSKSLGIGTTTMTGLVNITAPSTQTAANAYGLYVNGAQSTANSSGYYGIEVVPTYTAASGNTLATFSAVRGNSRNSGTGTVTSMTGLYGLPQNLSSGTVETQFGVLALPQNTSTGTVTTMIGLYGRCDNTNAGGTVTSCYALYLGTPTTTGAITNKYGLYQQDGNSTNYFAGSVGIGSVTPVASLNIVGNKSDSSWTSEGKNFAVKANTLTDTSGSGTIATRVANSFGIPTFASSSTVTLTNAATVYIAGPPSAGTNTTITNHYALHVASGRMLFAGGAFSDSGAVAQFSKTRDATNAQNYRFGDVGGLVSDSGGGAYWRGVMLMAPGITDPSGGATLYPGLALFAEYNSLTAPTTRNWVIATGNDTATSRHTLTFRLASIDAVTVDTIGSVGIGTTTPQSTLHVPDGKYAQFEDNNAGAPTAADCDSNTERGRLSIDTTNNRLYVCNGATRGWDYIALTD